MSTRLFKNLVLGLALVASTFVATPAGALSGSDFQAGRIIDDSVFFNTSVVNSGDIQNFLNAKVPSCDTNGANPIYDSAHGDTVSHAVYSQRRGVSTPFTCLKDYRQDTPSKSAESGLCNAYTGGNKSAAQIIYDVGQSCGINPQVLMVLLQKEQSLITDDWPWPIQYRSATGYGCPDTAACDSTYYGFFNQVYSAARQFKYYGRSPDQFNYRANATSYVLYNPNASCGGSNVYIQNQATANLYNYTPYQPNASALANLYGSGDGCGAYGNRNFWRLFNEWFGTTIGPDRAWAIDNFSFSGGDNVVATTQTETLTLRARNIGRAAWYNSGSNPVRLATWSYDRQSPLYKPGSWLSPTRVANMSESVVQPGEVGTFVFQITPNSTGTFIEGYNLVAEGLAWMPWPGFSPTINVFNGFSWNTQDIQYSTGGGILEPNTSQTITVHARNTGAVAWSKSSGPSIRVGRWAPGPSPVAQNWIDPARAAEMTETTVAPGEVGTFQFDVRVPGIGNYYERINLVAEGVTWMNDTGATLYLRGGVYSWQPLWHSHSTGTANIPRGQTFTLTVKAKNTGEVAWRKNGTIPIRLAPTSGGSPYYHSSWISPGRAASLVEDTVPPGGEGTFVFTATSPTTPGSYSQRFSLVAEGVAWFNDPGFSIYVNSL